MAHRKININIKHTRTDRENRQTVMTDMKYYAYLLISNRRNDIKTLHNIVPETLADCGRLPTYNDQSNIFTQIRSARIESQTRSSSTLRSS